MRNILALDFAKGATQIASTYYVTGNHEASLPQYDELKIGLESSGVVVLEDTLTQLEYKDETITLIGLSDPSFTIKGICLEKFLLWLIRNCGG